MYDGCEVSTRPSFSELELPYFWIWPSVFWVRTSRGFFKPDLPCFDLVVVGFFWVELILLYFDSVLPIYWVSPSLFWVVHFVFWLSPSRFFGSDLHYFDSVFPIHWVSPSLFCVSISRFLKSNFLSECFLFWLRTTMF